MGPVTADRLKVAADLEPLTPTPLPSGARGSGERVGSGRTAPFPLRQMIRSATGAGANYEEARAAECRDDFIHKVGVAAKETRETVYWLTLVDRSGWGGANLEPLLREATELAAILGASARTARNNAK
ncbi:MAG: four helix bundle protein, partial [Micrococcales bacterium]|nr:four helix bundle protein [Micrococcales bacterium]